MTENIIAGAAGGTFERVEIKYLLDAAQRRALEQVLQERCTPDIHGESTVCSLYCDTPDLRLARRSLEKPLYKEKLRLRSYGRVGPDGIVFLELKKKFREVVYKRRICLAEHDAMSFLLGEAPLPAQLLNGAGQEGQIAREINYACRFYGGPAPVMALCYDRTAWYDREDPGLRLTLDRAIRWRTDRLSLQAAPLGNSLLGAGQSLLEIKTGTAIPLWLTSLLSEQHLYKTSFSKYGSACTEALSQQKTEAVHHA